jgi:hypothetical protein
MDADGSITSRRNKIIEKKNECFRHWLNFKTRKFPRGDKNRKNEQINSVMNQQVSLFAFAHPLLFELIGLYLNFLPLIS